MGFNPLLMSRPIPTTYGDGVNTPMLASNPSPGGILSRFNIFPDALAPEERSARADALVQLGLGMIQGNQGNFGAIMPAIAAGGIAGFQGYKNALRDQAQRRQAMLQERLINSQIGENDAQTAERMRKTRLAAKLEADRKALVQVMDQEYAPILGSSSIVGDAQATSDTEVNAPGIQVTPGRSWQDTVEGNRAASMKAQSMGNQELAIEYWKKAQDIQKFEIDAETLNERRDARMDRPPRQATGAPGFFWNAEKKKWDYDPKIAEESRRQAAAGANQISFGSPVSVVDPRTGEAKLVQFDKTGRAKDTGFAPPSTAPKMSAEIQRQANALSALQKTLDAYESAMKDVDPRSFDQLDPQKKARIEAILADAIVNYKEAAALGALTGPDVGLIDRALTNPLSLKGAVYGKGGIGAQIGEARNAITRRQQSLGAGQTTFGGGGELPQGARKLLKEGAVTRFKNGQAWTLKDGKPMRVQ